MDIAVIPGDGIGPEIMEAALKVLSSVGFQADYEELQIGYEKWRETGTAITDDDLKILRGCEVVLKGPVTTPPRMKDSFKSVTLQIRRELDLYANVRPLKSTPISPFKGVDIVVFRENTEGIYAGEESFDGETAVTKRVITRVASQRIINHAFDYAMESGRSKVTCVHKANIMKMTCGLFQEVYQGIAANYPDITSEEVIVDACAYKMVSNPGSFDVIVTTNMFGDILSDLGAALIGSLGLLGSSNIGEDHVLFEPIHGTAPDIAGKKIANPTGMILASSYMLDHLGEEVGESIREAINRVLESRTHLTPDLGGQATTQEYTDAIIRQIQGPS
jgi:isocitrate dehydrogenase (NAD+)